MFPTVVTGYSGRWVGLSDTRTDWFSFFRAFGTGSLSFGTERDFGTGSLLSDTRSGCFSFVPSDTRTGSFSFGYENRFSFFRTRERRAFLRTQDWVLFRAQAQVASSARRALSNRTQERVLSLVTNGASTRKLCVLVSEGLRTCSAIGKEDCGEF